MFRSKVDVDRHVARNFTSLKSQHERNIRSYSIARLYFDVGDYESCRRYVENYLSVKDDNPAAHALLAQALCRLGQPRQALNSYQTALTLDPSQNNLILKVCELLADDSIPLDIGSARYWIDRATSHYPDHRAVFNLKRKILDVEGAEPDARMDLLEKEVSVRPYDSTLHVRLLKAILESEGAAVAFERASKIYFDKKRQFKDSIPWCESIVDILNLYRRQMNVDISWSYYLLKLTVLDKLIELYLGNERAPSEAEDVLKQLDGCLHEVCGRSVASAPSKSAVRDLISHFSGQFCLHSAGLLLKKAPRDVGGWRESTKNASPLLLLAYHCPPLTEKDENLVSTWRLSAADRRCQSGYTLLAFYQEKQNTFIDRISQICSGPHWRDKLYRKLFNNDPVTKQSNFLTSNMLQELQMRLPNSEDLKRDGILARKYKMDYLHDLVWHGMNATDVSEIDCSHMEGLPLSINNLPNCSAETLNRLDMEAFLYCCILSAKNLNEKTRRAGHVDPDRPLALPIASTEKLCTPAQIKWWECARAISKNESSTSGTDSRVVLCRGIETVRCSGGHGLDPVLISDLAKIFETRKKKVTDNVLYKFLDARTTLYYSESVQLLEKLRDKTYVKPPGRRLFDFSKELPLSEITTRIEEGKLYMALKFIAENENEKAVEILETVKSPYASYHLYKLYKKFSDEDMSGEETAYDIKPHRVLMLTKARDNLYLTMDRLKLSKVANDPLFDNLDSQLKCIDLQLPVMENRTSPNLHYSSAESYTSDNLLQLSKRQDQIEAMGRSSILIPSDNLEAQIKQLIDAHKILVVEVRKMKESVSDVKNASLTESPEKFKKLELHMDDIKQQICQYRDENASAVSELKDEISELRKEMDKLKLEKRHDENDLFLLEEENFAANASSVNAGLSYLQRSATTQPFGLYPPNPLYPLYTGQYPGMPMFPGPLLPQDQTLYQDLLLPARSLAPAAPVPAAPVLVPTTPQPKQGVHNYQIPLPTPMFNTIASTASFSPVSQTGYNQTSAPSMPLTSTPDKVGLEKLNNHPSEQPISLLKPFSFLEMNKSVSDNPTNLEGSFLDKSINKSRTLSEKSTDSYDPMPDYKPIIEMPERVELSTGEENEDVIFNERAKLYRLVTSEVDSKVTSEWKERGVGQMKLLKNKTTGSTRVLMRRDQIHKICANHVITEDINISPKENTPKVYCWGANDFAEEEFKQETFACRFSTVEIGNKFFDLFCKAIRDSANIPKASPVKDATPKPAAPKIPEQKTTKQVPNVTAAPTVETSKPNPFSGFTFGKPSTAPAFSTPATTNNSTSIFSVAKSNLGPNEKSLFDKVGDLFIIYKNNSSNNNQGKATGNMQVILNEEDVKLSRLYFSPQSATLLQCNHRIKESMKFENLNTQSNAITWSDSAFPLTYVVSFSSRDICEQFKNSVTEIQNNILNIQKGLKNNSNEKKNSGASIPVVVSGWGDKFKPKAGSWDCSVCYINNEASSVYCVACENPKDPSIPKKEQKNLFGTTVEQKFTFGIPPATDQASKVEKIIPTTTTSGWGDKFKPKPGSWNCTACYTNNDASAVYCVACEGPKDSTVPKKEQNIFATTGEQKFTFGIPPAVTTATPQPATTNAPIFTLPMNSTTNVSSFITGLPKTNDSNKFCFTPPTSQNQTSLSSDKSEFKFVFKPKSPEKANRSTSSDNEYAIEDDGDHLQFKPVVALPAKVDVVTGEEDEDLIHSIKAKLYKFTKSEWKECGVGDIKLLKHKTTGKYRIVMRRDVVLKVCLNYILTKDTELIAKDQKAWTFSAIDFSSEIMEPQLFCVSFQNKDIAAEYFNVIQKAKSDLKSNKPGQAVKDDDVVFVSETKATEEQVQKARKLQLPDNFYLYENKPDCPGCAGCKTEAVPKTPEKPKVSNEKPPVTPEQVFKQYQDNLLKTEKLQVFGAPPPTQAKESSIFSSLLKKSESNSDDSEEKPVSMFSGMGGVPAFSLSGASDLFSKPLGPFGAISEKPSIFGSLATNKTEETKPPAEAPIFGSFTGALDFNQLGKMSSGNIFGIKTNENGNANEPEKTYSWPGAGTALFSKSAPKSEDHDEEDNDADHDPQFKPIIPLPDKIEVVTGEEDEKLIFKEHCSLYRKAEKEWKLRGNGYIKILYHPEKLTYRLILRWDTLHKVVLNQLIHKDFQLDALTSDPSGKSLFWGGINYTDDKPEGSPETLAVKFKNPDIATKFKEIVKNAINNIVKNKHGDFAFLSDE